MERNKTILIIGATGLLGKMAALQFLSDGFSVKALVRNPENAKNVLPKEIELIKGDITQIETVANAAKDTDYLHISISGGNEMENILKVEFEGVKNVINAAQKQNLKRISMISGMAVNEQNQSHPSEKAKLMAEQELKNSGVGYTIFKPGFFMETLEKFVQKNKALLLGKQPNPLHLIAANDLMRNISKSYHIAEAESKSFYVIGKEAMLLKDALRQYVNKLYPGMKVSVIPLWLVKPINRLFMKGRLTRVIGIMEILQQKGEEGDPNEYVRIFGEHQTTFEQWLNAQKIK